jgi:hypothetical protein
MEFIKHFITNDGGRFAVAVDGTFFVMAHLSGPAPRPGHLALAIESWPQLQEAANESAASRMNPYATERIMGMSGAENYRLRECRNQTVGDFPVRATIHVSMYGKLNQGIRLWLGDLPALCWPIFLNHPVEEEMTVREVAVFQPAYTGWQTAPLRFEVDAGGLTVAGQPAPEPEGDQAVAWALLASLDKEVDE